MVAIMDVLPVAGDCFQFAAVTALMWNIISRRSCGGISGRSQLLFAITYITRNWDLWYKLEFVYSWTRIPLICISWSTVFLINVVFQHTYQRKKDVFLTEMLLIPSFVLSLWVKKDNFAGTIMYEFSCYLESVAILPQLFMILDDRKMEKGLLPYFTCMGIYKLIYLGYWLYLYQTEKYFDPIEIGSNILYTVIFFLSMIEFFFVGVTIVDSGRQNFFKNIFLINTNEPLTDRLNLVSDDSLENEKTNGSNQVERI